MQGVVHPSHHPREQFGHEGSQSRKAGAGNGRRDLSKRPERSFNIGPGEVLLDAEIFGADNRDGHSTGNC